MFTRSIAGSCVALGILALVAIGVQPANAIIYDNDVVLHQTPYASHGWVVGGIGPNPLTDGTSAGTYAYPSPFSPPNTAAYNLGRECTFTSFAIDEECGAGRSRLNHILLDVSNVPDFSTKTEYDLPLADVDGYQTVTFTPVLGQYVQVVDLAGGSWGSPSPDRYPPDSGTFWDGTAIAEVFVYGTLVPEPSTVLLLALGGLTMWGARRQLRP